MIAVIYHAAFDRQPNAEAVEYWLDAGIEHLAYAAVTGAEPTKGDVAEWYERALGRAPDPNGLVFWMSQPAHEALYGIVTSTEATGCVTEHDAAMGEEHPPGWVDGGNGVWLPSSLIEIRRCESDGDYGAQNPRSTASGAYQFLDSSWEAYGHADRYGVRRAKYATPAQQDEAALLTWQRDGTRPWAASRRCHGR